MAELVLTNVDDTVLGHLRERAERNGRTSVDEAKAIIANALHGRTLASWTGADTIYQRLAASGRDFSNSADLLREDRDR